MVDYRTFRLNRLNTPQFRHLIYLLFWPVYGLAFLTVERLWIRDFYFPMHCALDDYIPLIEYFLIPYLFWFVFLVGIHLYTLLYDVPAFVKMERFFIYSYALAVVIYILFPNCQELRPTEFTRDNLLTRFLVHFYQFDTNTNVCPSIHVIGSIAVVLGAWNTRGLSTFRWRLAFSVTAFLISISTIFLRQHSVLDLLAAIPVCLVSYYLAYVYVPGKRSNAGEASPLHTT